MYSVCSTVVSALLVVYWTGQCQRGDHFFEDVSPIRLTFLFLHANGFTVLGIVSPSVEKRGGGGNCVASPL